MKVVARRTGSASATGMATTQAGWACGVCCGLVMVGVLPIMLTSVSLEHLTKAPVLLTLAILAYSTLRISRLLVAGREAVLEATFWIYVYIFYGLAALAQTVSETYALPPYTAYEESISVRALIVVVIGLFAYECGRVLARSRAPRPSSDTGMSLIPRRVAFLVIVGVASTLFFVLNEGLGLQFSSRYRTEVSYLGAPSPGLRVDQLSDKAVGLIKIFLRWVPAFVALYLLLHLRRAAREGSLQPRWINAKGGTAVLVLMIVVNVIMSNPISNPRSRFGGVIMALGLALSPLRTPPRFRAAVIGLLVALLFVFPLADAFRYDERDFTVAPLSQDLVRSPDFSMYQQELNAQLYVRESGHTLGRQALGAVFVFVPRRWWPDKPIATGDLISRTTVLNASDSLWAEAYVDGGYGAVFLFFLLYGRTTFLMERAYLHRVKGVVSAAVVFVPLFAGFQILILRGSLQPVIGELVPVGLVAFACCSWQRRQSNHLEANGPEKLPSYAVTGSA